MFNQGCGFQHGIKCKVLMVLILSAQVREIDPLLQMEQTPLEPKMPTLTDKAPIKGVPGAELNQVPLFPQLEWNASVKPASKGALDALVHPTESSFLIRTYKSMFPSINTGCEKGHLNLTSVSRTISLKCLSQSPSSVGQTEFAIKPNKL